MADGPLLSHDDRKMQRFRQPRLRARLSLLAMVALLWTQLALASHPACTLASMALSGDHAGTMVAGKSAPEPCHPAPPTGPAFSAGCELHCSRSDLAPDAPRLLSVPALGPLPIPPLVLTGDPSPAIPAQAPSPTPLGAWHRPTSHPASLLLI